MKREIINVVSVLIIELSDIYLLSLSVIKKIISVVIKSNGV